jgi:glycosyltransferase involved in cell wall biosynthesis
VTGEYVLFVDADDYISTDMLQVVNTYLCHNPYNIDILSFSAAWFINGEVYEFTQGYKE